MLTALFQVLGAALILWENHEKQKYLDRYLSLKRSYYDEVNKPTSTRSDAVLDDIEFSLRLLGTAFAASVNEPHVAPSP